MDINDLTNRAYQIAKNHGWTEKEIPIPEMCALIHSEVSEMLEAYRSGEPYLHIKNGKPEGIASELADIVIRVAHYSRVLKIDLNEALKIKLRYNKTRPYRHGGKLC